MPGPPADAATVCEAPVCEKRVNVDINILDLESLLKVQQ